MASVPKLLATFYNDASLRTNCSGFFKAVAKKLNVPLPDVTADVLIDQISASWIYVGQGTVGGAQAATLAQQGYLVVALLKAKDHLPYRFDKKTGKYDIPHPYSHGHLSVVIGGAVLDGFPYVVSGSMIADGQSDGSKAVKGVWRGVDAPNVKYYRTSSTFAELTAP